VQNVLRSGSHALVAGGINTAINGGSLKDNLGNALSSEGLDFLAAFGNKQVGDLADYLGVDPGTAGKILMHAVLGGALSAAQGGDFKTGALAGAAAEGLTQLTTDALGRYLDDRFATDDQFKIGTAQIIGVLAGALGGSDDAATASWVAGNAERYNQQVHREAAARLEKGFVTLHEQGQFLDLQPQDVLVDLQKIADGEKDPSKLNPGTVEFLNQFSPADLREIFFEPTLTEQIIGLGIDLFFPTPTGKTKAAATIAGPVGREILESLEKKFGAALAEGTAKGASDAASIGGKTCVYSCVVDGITRYVGITDDIVKRGQAHLREKGIVIEGLPGLENLSRADARAVEQTLIDYHGLGKDGGDLINKINSISTIKNPTKFEQGLIRGAELLNKAGYEGF
jgi:filamentous hemagglutinin